MMKSCPPEAPLDMPEQPFSRKRAFPEGVRKSYYWRKIFLVLSALLITTWLGWLMFRVLNVMGLTHLEWGLLALFIINIGWISFAFVSACAGFCVSLLRGASEVDTSAVGLKSRTAILFPVYNETVSDVFATVESTAQALAKAAPGRFECFILSDTVDADTALEEESGFISLSNRSNPGCPVYFRRRTINVARKSGNIHDFVLRWGRRYDHFLIFDADSYISAETLIEMVARMEGDNRLGLLQTVPKLIGGTSLFARVQQFAAAVYGPVLGQGIAWWSQNEGNYWGHNAIIRTKAFAEAAGLPVLPGRAPFGGHIMSHDFVEAALLRRAGWKVRIAADLKGSYEEGPQTIIDLTIRDRRWCQGNLQHTAVLARARGITGTNRLHFMIGIFSYLASPLWMVLILVGMALSLQNRFLKPEYFSTDPSLTPSWPVIDPALALSVFGFTMAVLLLPKLFGAIVAMVKARHWKSRLLVLPGVLLETLVSALTAPILMVAQTASFVSILTGRDSGWTPQQRGSDGYRFVDIARRHAVTTVLGVVLTYAAWRISPVFAAWLAPATLGMVLAIPLSWSLGRDTMQSAPLARMLSTPEARQPPECFSSALAARQNYLALAPPDLRHLIGSDETEFRSHVGLVDNKWPLGATDVHIPLATASAKLDRFDDLDTFLTALGPKEEMAVLNSVETMERARARFQAARQPAFA